MQQVIVDVFSETVFGGNPTAVCFAEEWPEDEAMRRIAAENRLSETAFVRKKDGRYGLRWFTAVREIPLCGHAALGAGYAVLREWEPGAEAVTFDTLSGALTVAKRDGRVEMRMPRWPLAEVSVTEDMTEAVGAPVRAAYLARDLLCILENEAAVRRAAPDMARVKALPGLLLNLAAKGTDCDCVVRSLCAEARRGRGSGVRFGPVPRLRMARHDGGPDVVLRAAGVGPGRRGIRAHRGGRDVPLRPCGAFFGGGDFPGGPLKRGSAGNFFAGASGFLL